MSELRSMYDRVVFALEILIGPHRFTREVKVTKGYETPYFIGLSEYEIEIKDGVTVSEEKDSNGQAYLKISAGNGSVKIRCRCPKSYAGLCISSRPIEGGPWTCGEEGSGCEHPETNQKFACGWYSYSLINTQELLNLLS